MTESRRDLLLHPVRLRIVETLAGQDMTPQELLDRLGDVAQATLYRHVNQLEAAGLIEVVDERQVRGGIERTYRVVDGATRLRPEDLEDATPSDMFQLFATFVGTLVSDFSAHLERQGDDLDVVGDRIGFSQVPLWLTDEEFDRMSAALADIIAPLAAHERTGDRRRRLLSIIVMPDDR